MFSPSATSKIVVQGRDFYVKRDDLTHKYLSGNKYRKLHTLLQTPSEKFDTIISYGGTQSNAMLAIAAMCQLKGWRFLYYTKPLSQVQKDNPQGNYRYALSLGMEHQEIEHELYRDHIASLALGLDERTFLIDQGGAVVEAKAGLEVLAQEIRQSDLGIRSIATPSGTGTTALFLALALPKYKIYTTPCVGDEKYLRQQMQALYPIPKNLIILTSERKYHFAKVYAEHFDIYKKLLNAGIEFDLLYAPLMWKNLLEQTSESILYVHSGGVSGNESMLKRYEKKGFIL